VFRFHSLCAETTTAFYALSSSKPSLKKELQAAKVPTSSFQEFDHPPVLSDLDHIIDDIGFPMIVKPSISYASINISMKSVVHTPEELLEQVHWSLAASMPEGSPPKVEPQIRPNQEYQHPLKAKVVKDYIKEFDIETPTVFVEKFLAGREFTALVIGDKSWGVRVFPVAERAFDPRLGKFERLLAFDQ
jgi:D-alanine-D-alanine ligase-like ATP-grasp enzyme